MPGYSTGVSPVWIEALDELDRGTFREALVRFDVDTPDDDVAHSLWRAELLMYLDRLDEARLELPAAGQLDGRLSARAKLISAELLLWDGAHEEALDRAESLAARAAYDEPIVFARARTLVARCAVRRGDYKTSLRLIQGALTACTEAGLGSCAGILYHCRAYAQAKLGDVSACGVSFARALEHLQSTGDVRWEESCRAVYGLWLMSIGQTADAEREFRVALEMANDLGIPRDVLWIENNLVQLQLTFERYAEAAATLEHILEWELAGRFGIAEANSRVSLAYALGMNGRLDLARRAGASALEVARLVGSEDVTLDAALVTAWLGALEGAPDAVADLRALRSVAADRGTIEQAFKATLFLADALVGPRPDEAGRLWHEALGSEEANGSGPYHGLVARVQHRMAHASVRVGPNGELIFDVRRKGFPGLYSAIEMLERYLVTEALDAANGSQAEAARQLATTRSVINDKYKKHVLERPARERYAKPDGRARRSRSGEQQLEDVE